jgi:hypothetical protein
VRAADLPGRSTSTPSASKAERSPRRVETFGVLAVSEQANLRDADVRRRVTDERGAALVGGIVDPVNQEVNRLPSITRSG